jgi:serine protease
MSSSLFSRSLSSTLEALQNQGLRQTSLSAAVASSEIRDPLTASLIPTNTFTASRSFPYPGNSIAEAFNLGTVTTQRVFSEEIGGAIQINPGIDFIDFLRFDLSSVSNLTLSLTGLRADVDMYLVQDFNNNQELDDGEFLSYSNVARNTSERIDLEGLAAGTYYAVLFNWDAYVTNRVAYTPYTLTLTRSLGDAGATYETAQELGVLNGQTQISDRVSSQTDPGDLYRFYLDTPSDLQLTLSGLTGDADLSFVRDVNNNGLLDTPDYIAESILSGTAVDRITRTNLAAGTYFAYVNPFLTTTPYTLTLTADGAGGNYGTARDLGVLTNATRTFSDFVDSADSRDAYRFQLNETSTITLNLSGLNANANLYLTRDLNGNGRFDVGEILRQSTAIGTANEQIVFDRLTAGNYFVFVDQFSGSTNYVLDVSTTAIATQTLRGSLNADVFTPNSLFSRVVISGNGNIDFGDGLYDILNLSNVVSTGVRRFDRVEINRGVAYDPGNGTRLFDRIVLANGQEILFEGIDRVRFADRDIVLSVTPNDPLFNLQSNLHLMGVQDAWRLTTGSSNVAIGVQDSGLGVNFGSIHPDLNPQRTFTSGNNYIDELFDTTFGIEPYSHGTAVQSVIAATTNNRLGMSGINWNAPVYNVDVLGDNLGDLTLAEATRQILQSTANRGQRLIMNLSLGGDFAEADFNQLVAQNPNVLFIIAAGNDGETNLLYPAFLAQQYSNVLAVGSIEGALGRSDYSNYGSGLSLVAPTNVIAASAANPFNRVEFDYIDDFGGTSAATPNVAGVASLVWSANQRLTATQVGQILQQTAIDLGAPGYDIFYGNGLVNADAAVRRALAIA